jgi:hypothetical protein
MADGFILIGLGVPIALIFWAVAVRLVHTVWEGFR